MPLFPHQSSAEWTKSELEIFSLPPTQVSIEETKLVPYHPLAAITDNSPIEFLVSGKGEDYLDLSHSILHLRVKIVNSDGTDIQAFTPAVGGAAAVAATPVAPVNLLLHSLFQQIDVTLNDRTVSSSDNCYAYRSYIETLLNFGREAKNSYLYTQGWWKDEAGKFNDNNPAPDAANSGLKARQLMIQGSRSLELYGRLHCDIFANSQALISGVDLRLRMFRSKASFCLMSSTQNPDYKILIEKATFMACKVTPTASIRLAHESALNDKMVKFPVNRVELKNFTLATGSLQANLDNAISGQVPDRIIVGLVSGAAFNGSWTLNPFNFAHHGKNHILLSLDGKPISPTPLRPDFTNNSYVLEYLTLFQNTGRYMKDEGIDITYDEYRGGFALYAFDLTPDGSSGEPHFNLIKTGSIRLELKFEVALPATVNVIVYAEYQTVIEIDKTRNVIAEF